MQKRYQVFVSSTYSDLREERQLVLRALMELDCIPAGMELFPAADEEQWAFVKQVIDDCDYYLLIIGGRYGSVTEDGVSYTEKEFDYAQDRGIPVIALLHEDPGLIPFGKSEPNPTAQKKLASFRERVSTGRLVKFWKNSAELPGMVALSLARSMKMYPGIGWVRGNEPAGTEILREINETRIENARLTANVATLEAAYRGAPKVIDPNEGSIPGTIRKIMEDSRLWQYRGATGTWFRAVTLRVISSRARETNSAKEIWVEIINPCNGPLLESYARYRGMVRSALSDEPWTPSRVRSECVATLCSISETMVHEPLVRVHLSLGRDYSALRYDLGDSGLVITTEEPSEPALHVERTTRHYETWRTELSRSFREGLVLDFEAAKDVVRGCREMRIEERDVATLLRSFGESLAPCIARLDAAEVCSLVKSPRNRYE